jgi:hypothetical protein
VLIRRLWCLGIGVSWVVLELIGYNTSDQYNHSHNSLVVKTRTSVEGAHTVGKHAGERVDAVHDDDACRDSLAPAKTFSLSSTPIFLKCVISKRAGIERPYLRCRMEPLAELLPRNQSLS